MSINPIGNNLILKLNEEEKTSEAGIIIKESKNYQVEGLVIAVGEGNELPNGKVIPLKVKVGDNVLLHKLAAQRLEHEKEELYIVPEDKIHGILEAS